MSFAVMGNSNYESGKSIAASQFSTWYDPALAGHGVLQQMVDSIGRVERGEGFLAGDTGENISLIKLADHKVHGDENQVVFVHWANTRAMSGRVIELDDEHRVKSIVCVGKLRHPTDYSTAVLLAPDCGVSMRRMGGPRGQLRPAMPYQWVKLRTMWRIALGMASCIRIHLAPGEQHSTARHAVIPDPCALCNLLVVGPSDVDKAEVEDMSTCPLCVANYHTGCAEIFAKLFKDNLQIVAGHFRFQDRTVGRVLAGLLHVSGRTRTQLLIGILC
jgi:hypothetical protein